MGDGRPVERLLGKKSKVDIHIEKVMGLLYDYGPHTAEQISDHLGMSVDWTQEIMSSMKAEGLVVKMIRGENHHYWILKEDALAA